MDLAWPWPLYLSPGWPSRGASIPLNKYKHLSCKCPHLHQSQIPKHCLLVTRQAAELGQGEGFVREQLPGTERSCSTKPIGSKNLKRCLWLLGLRRAGVKSEEQTTHQDIERQGCVLSQEPSLWPSLGGLLLVLSCPPELHSPTLSV